MPDTREDATPRLQRAGPERDTLLDELLEAERAGLRRMVELRMDPRLRQRLDASDVLQEAFWEAARRLDDYLEAPDMPFHVWVRFLTGQRLLHEARYHLGAQCRDLRRQVSLNQPIPCASSCAVADLLVDEGTSPSGAVSRNEAHTQLTRLLDEMDPLDQEVLVLRHFEHLGNGDVAAYLGISVKAASNRYVRALSRLATLMEVAPWPDRD